MTPIYLDNDMIATLRNLKNAVSGEFLNDASVEMTVKDSDGDEVTGQSWPVTMDYVDASDGTYQGTIESTVSLVPGAYYFAHLEVVRGEFNASFKLPLQARYRSR